MGRAGEEIGEKSEAEARSKQQEQEQLTVIHDGQERPSVCVPAKFLSCMRLHLGGG